MSKHIIHIGSNRAASTSLQKNLFNKIEAFYHIGLNSKLNFECKNNFKKLISSRTQYNFNNPLKKKIDQLKKKKKKIINFFRRYLLFSSNGSLCLQIIKACAKRRDFNYY